MRFDPLDGGGGLHMRGISKRELREVRNDVDRMPERINDLLSYLSRGKFKGADVSLIVTILNELIARLLVLSAEAPNSAPLETLLAVHFEVMERSAKLLREDLRNGYAILPAD
jgi:hypothetical protein